MEFAQLVLKNVRKSPKVCNLYSTASRSKCTHIQTDILNAHCSHCREISKAQSFQESCQNIFMNLTLLLHIEREVAFPPESASIPVLCILQIKHFKIIFFCNSLLRREKCCVWLFLLLFCVQKEPLNSCFYPTLKTKYQYCSNFSIPLFSNVTFCTSASKFIYAPPDVALPQFTRGSFSFLPPSKPIALHGEVSCLIFTSLLHDQIPVFCHFCVLMFSTCFTLLDM